jgi:hypothetical protein
MLCSYCKERQAETKCFEGNLCMVFCFICVKELNRIDAEAKEKEAAKGAA